MLDNPSIDSQREATLSVIAFREAPELGALALTGDDGASFLQGYVTSDTRGLDEGWQPTAFTSLKGRVTATALLRQTAADHIDIVVSADLVEALQTGLAKYLMFARCELNAVDAPIFAYLGEGPDSQQWFDGAGLCLNDPPVGAEPALTDAAWHEARLGAGVAWVSAATTDTFLPQMLGLIERGYVSFDKGCYLGQEVVARAAHRGEVKRGLVHLAWTGSAAPRPGDDVCRDGKRIGTITDCTPQNEVTEGHGDAASQGSALAVCRIDAAAESEIGTEAKSDLEAADGTWAASHSAI